MRALRRGGAACTPACVVRCMHLDDWLAELPRVPKDTWEIGPLSARPPENHRPFPLPASLFLLSFLAQDFSFKPMARRGERGQGGVGAIGGARAPACMHLMYVRVCWSAGHARATLAPRIYSWIR
jgi:hypothetical protein